MSELIASLKVLLSNTYNMYYVAHSSHWNVEGKDFPQYHSFFEMIYSEVYGSIDDIAENIRKLDDYAPTKLSEIVGSISGPESDVIGTSLLEMISTLTRANDSVLESIVAAYKLAESNDEIGLSNFLQDREMAHKKHRWMLKASSK
jgi:starvation-inducible DNA-binding protein